MSEAIRASLRATSKLYVDMSEVLAEPAARAAELLIAAFKGGGALYVCGDGGSAAESQHIAGELVGRFLMNRPALPCVALTTDTSILTAVANDYDFSRTFERQVEALVKPGDVLWALSTSGNSPNVLKAAVRARQRGAKVLGMTGRSGGKLAELCDLCLCVPADSSPAIQEGHLTLIHILCRLVEEALFAGPEGGAR
ncbi:MAG: D-sedoheptulose 7-phosphate isomerase [Planctomycetes bacterium]|nr:D-sedoheptulose 7-phosphate isomerase [Planctomycetota bacterium]